MQKINKVSVDQLRVVMDLKNNIRNISVVAHVDHGKSTLTDSLLASNGIISYEDAGKKRATDTLPDEQLKGITIKSTGVTLLHSMDQALAPRDADVRSDSPLVPFLINLIDSPGHVDFSSEVTAALRLTDGALVLIDYVEGCCVQTETVLRQALAERIHPVLTINKLDRAFLELQHEPEEIYQTCMKWIEFVNSVISTFNNCPEMGDCSLNPLNGSVCFSAGKQGWAFNLPQFARIIAKSKGIPEDKVLPRLWGEHYYDPETNKFSTSNTSLSGKPLQRVFCQFVLEPIRQIFQLATCNDVAQIEQLALKRGIPFKPEDRELRERDLVRAVMQRWLPAAEALLETIITHLPSPARAQKYRVQTLYTGSLDDQTAASIRNCDPKGPLVVFISKQVPTRDLSRFYSFGRVFSGTVTAGQKVRIMGAQYTPGKKDDLFTNVSIQRTVIMMGAKQEAVDSVPCGNTVALLGIDGYLNKSGTVTTQEDSFPLINMKYSVSPVVRVAVEVTRAEDLPRLVTALQLLSKSDPLVQVFIEQTGEHIIACAGDLHLEICLNDLRRYMNGAELKVGNPIVPFRETVMASSSLVCLSKSPNHHNRLFGTAEPLSLELVAAIEQGEIQAKDEPKARARKLIEKFAWDPVDARKIWAFGPETISSADATNVLVDATRAIAYLSEIKDSVSQAFGWATKEGVLANEMVRGVRFTLLDAMLHPDAVHRGAGQILPSAQRLFHAAQLTASPRLMEPVYLVDIQCPQAVVSSVYNVLNQRRGVVIDSVPREGTPLFSMKAYLPVKESFGFSEFLRSETSGQAFPQCVFDHWELMTEDPLEPNSKTRKLVLEIRGRKGVRVEKDIPPLERFLDKI